MANAWAERVQVGILLRIEDVEDRGGEGRGGGSGVVAVVVFVEEEGKGKAGSTPRDGMEERFSVSATEPDVDDVPHAVLLFGGDVVVVVVVTASCPSVSFFFTLAHNPCGGSMEREGERASPSRITHSGQVHHVLPNGITSTACIVSITTATEKRTGVLGVSMAGLSMEIQD